MYVFLENKNISTLKYIKQSALVNIENEIKCHYFITCYNIWL